MATFNYKMASGNSIIAKAAKQGFSAYTFSEYYKYILAPYSKWKYANCEGEFDSPDCVIKCSPSRTVGSSDVPYADNNLVRLDSIYFEGKFNKLQVIGTNNTPSVTGITNATSITFNYAKVINVSTTVQTDAQLTLTAASLSGELFTKDKNNEWDYTSLIMFNKLQLSDGCFKGFSGATFTTSPNPNTSNAMPTNHSYDKTTSTFTLNGLTFCNCNAVGFLPIVNASLPTLAYITGITYTNAVGDTAVTTITPFTKSSGSTANLLTLAYNYSTVVTKNLSAIDMQFTISARIDTIGNGMLIGNDANMKFYHNDSQQASTSFSTNLSNNYTAGLNPTISSVADNTFKVQINSNMSLNSRRDSATFNISFSITNTKAIEHTSSGDSISSPFSSSSITDSDITITLARNDSASNPQIAKVYYTIIASDGTYRYLTVEIVNTRPGS